MEEEKNLIDRIKSKTPQRHKKIGKLATVLGAIAGGVLATGLIVNPVGIIALTVIAIAGGGKALYHAQKVDE